jgi:ketosteroid isomerase-like protein
MITEAFAKDFAAEWVDSWNSHDLDRILSHYTEDFSIETPKALQFVPESKGKLKGKPAIRDYWTIGLKKIPNLKFEILDVLTGIDGLTVYYFNCATKQKSVENMFFDKDGKVNRVFVHYS